MASISDKKIVDEITSNKGVYGAGTAEADPAVTHISSMEICLTVELLTH